MNPAKVVIGWWCFGCLLWGLGYGLLSQDCGKWQKVEPGEAAEFVAVWPALIPLMLMRMPDDKPACHNMDSP